jgi:hypothetical protein
LGYGATAALGLARLRGFPDSTPPPVVAAANESTVATSAIKNIADCGAGASSAFSLPQEQPRHRRGFSCRRRYTVEVSRSAFFVEQDSVFFAAASFIR